MINSPGWAALIDVKMADGVIQAVSNARLVPYGLNLVSAPPSTIPAPVATGALASALIAALSALPKSAGSSGMATSAAATAAPQPDQERIAAVASHGRNVLLCESLYPSLHLLEIVIRNRINDEFAKRFGAANWYDQAWLTANHQQLIADAKAGLVKKNRSLQPDRVVAELGFGFWCGMFSGQYEIDGGPWPTLLRAVLPNVPKRYRMRSKIRSRLEDARALRNRVFHHEAISLLPNLPQRHRELSELIGWMSGEARQHLEHMCRFESVFNDQIKYVSNPSEDESV